MTDLVARLTASLDEADARVTPPGTPRFDQEWEPLDDAIQEWHERELRMVAAHRKILDLHPSDGQGEPLCDGCGGSFHWPCPTLRALAEAYGVEA